MKDKTKMTPELRANLGTRDVRPLRPARFPEAGTAVQTLTSSKRPPGASRNMSIAC